MRFKKPDLAIKWHGGQAYAAPTLNAMMPPHTRYIEPYAGGLAVLLGHSGEGRSEIINDVDSDLMNFWGVLRDASLFGEFHRFVSLLPFHRDIWEWGEYVTSFPVHNSDDDASRILQAAAFFVYCRQSYAGRMKQFAVPTRSRLRGGMNADVNAYLSAVDRLPEIHARLRRVFVENMPALDLIRREDGPDAMFYLDPPWLPSGRATPDVYRHEMTEADHRSLLVVIRKCRGRVMISGCPSILYDDLLPANRGWHRTDLQLVNQASGSAEKSTLVHCVWTNFRPQRVK